MVLMSHAAYRKSTLAVGLALLDHFTGTTNLILLSLAHAIRSSGASMAMPMNAVVLHECQCQESIAQAI
jgi:hypothetical protein